MKYILDFYTQYSQFYIADKLSPHETSGDFWDKAAYEDRLAIGTGIVGVGTECYGPVKGELHVLPSSTSEDELEAYDHVVEGPLTIMSGVLQVLDCPNSNVELQITLPAKDYAVRVYSSNLASVEGDEGDDFYKIEIWPCERIQRRVLKRYQ